MSSSFTLHVDHLAGHLVGVRVTAVVELALGLEHLRGWDDEAGTYCSLQMMFLKGEEEDETVEDQEEGSSYMGTYYSVSSYGVSVSGLEHLHVVFGRRVIYLGRLCM